jgi:hypothetical protein
MDETKAIVRGDPGDLVIEEPTPVVPAAPGFEILTAYAEGDSTYKHYGCEPVIAWRIEPLEPSPISPGCSADLSNYQAIRYPNGKIRRPFEEFLFENADAWLDCLNAEREAVRERKEKSAAKQEELESHD